MLAVIEEFVVLVRVRSAIDFTKPAASAAIGERKRRSAAAPADFRRIVAADRMVPMSSLPLLLSHGESVVEGLSRPAWEFESEGTPLYDLCRCPVSPIGL
jgi:hypothetical protein